MNEQKQEKTRTVWRCMDCGKSPLHFVWRTIGGTPHKCMFCGGLLESYQTLDTRLAELETHIEEQIKAKEMIV